MYHWREEIFLFMIHYKPGIEFKLYYPSIKESILLILNKYWMKMNPSALFRKVASCFLTFCMDVLQDAFMVRKLALTNIHTHFSSISTLDNILFLYNFDAFVQLNDFLTNFKNVASGYILKLLCVNRNGLACYHHDGAISYT